MKINLNYIPGFILIFAFVLTPPKIFSQQDAQLYKRDNNSFSLTAGINSFHIRDRKISAVSYANNIYSMNLCYNYTATRTKNTLEINGSTGGLHSDIVNRPVTQYGIELFYKFGFKTLDFRLLGVSNETYIGPELRCSYYYTKIAFDKGVMPEWEYSFFLNRTAGFGLSNIIRINDRNSLECGISIPLLSLVSRPGYSIIIIPNKETPKDVAEFFYVGKVEYIWENFIMFVDLNYVFRITGGLGAKIYYKFSTINESSPKQLNLFTNYFGAGVAWSF